MLNTMHRISEIVFASYMKMTRIFVQVDTWFTLGCALLRLEKYEKASDAFRRCVNLDWDVSG